MYNPSTGSMKWCVQPTFNVQVLLAITSLYQCVFITMVRCGSTHIVTLSLVTLLARCIAVHVNIWSRSLLFLPSLALSVVRIVVPLLSALRLKHTSRARIAPAAVTTTTTSATTAIKTTTTVAISTAAAAAAAVTSHSPAITAPLSAAHLTSLCVLHFNSFFGRIFSLTLARVAA